MIRFRAHCYALALAIIAFVSSTAFADMGPAQTGLTAGANSASAAVFNPAGLTRLADKELEIGLMGIRGNSTFELTAAGVSGRLSNDLTSKIIVPSLFYTQRLADRWWAGASLSATGGLGTTYATDWPGRYFLQEWTLGLGGLTGSVGWKISDRFSIGASATLNYSIYNQESAVLNVDPGLGDGQFKLEATGTVPAFSVAALYEATDRTRIGAVFRSETEPELTGTPEYSNLGPTRTAWLSAKGTLDTEVTINSRLPRSVFFGLYHELGNGAALSLDVTWVNFSRFSLPQTATGDSTLVTVVSNYQDIFGASVGVRIPAGERWELRAGAMAVSAGIKDENRTFSLGMDALWGVGIGADRRISERQSFGLNFNFYKPGSAPVNTPDLPLVGAIRGEYTSATFFMLDASYAFRF